MISIISDSLLTYMNDKRTKDNTYIIIPIDLSGILSGGDGMYIRYNCESFYKKYQHFCTELIDKSDEEIGQLFGNVLAGEDDCKNIYGIFTRKTIGQKSHIVDSGDAYIRGLRDICHNLSTDTIKDPAEVVVVYPQFNIIGLDLDIDEVKYHTEIFQILRTFSEITNSNVTIIRR